VRHSKIGPPMMLWVHRDTFGRGEVAIDVRYASNSDQGNESQQNVAMCQKRL
jgi:hypothetical protein